MKNKVIILLSSILIIGFVFYRVNCSNVKQKNKKFNIQMILGSTRQGRLSDKLGNIFKEMADKRNDVSFELIDLRDYKIPFLNDDIPPANRKEITDLNIKAWSDKIKEGDAYIILSPEYNSSIPGVLKNALDSLYVEWNNKPAAVITYSGGPLGGANAMNHLNQILSALEMKVIKENIKIPSSWKALNDQGNLTDNNIEKEFNIMLDELKK